MCSRSTGSRFGRGLWWAIVLGLAATGPAGAQSLTNQHVSSAGVQGNAWAANDDPSLSNDGRHVAFASQADNLVPDDFNGYGDVFVHDNLTGATVMISRSPGGGGADEACRRPWLSATGRYVVFQSLASNLVAVDGNGQCDVFRHDRDADGDGIFDEAGATATILVSVSTAGVQGNGPSRSYSEAISDDGDVIVFESDATNLLAGGADTNGSTDCFARTISTGTTVRLSVATGGAQGNGSSMYPAVSGNGLSVAFDSVADNLVPGDTNDEGDVFLRALLSGTTTRVSVATDGTEALGGSWWPSISDDGMVIAFDSSAPNLVLGDGNGGGDAFVRDLAAGTTTRVSVQTGGAEADGGSGQPRISGDGLVVAFDSPVANLVSGDTNGTYDVFVHDRATGATARASRAGDGTQGNNQSFMKGISVDGEYVAFYSWSSNWPPDTNGTTDIFRRGQPFDGPGGGDPPPPPPPPPPPGPAAPDPYPVTFSVNGPVDPHTEGIRYVRGTPATPQIPAQPGNPVGYGIRIGPVAQATGLPTPFPGDVFDYDAAGVPSEAVMFQSPPLAPAFPGPPTPPDGTNNQILEASAMGLVAGLAAPTPLWTTVPPERDNVDAFSFGEDYFPEGIVTGLSDTLFPAPPAVPAMTPWPARTSLYDEPIVVSDEPGISFRFSVNPWAIGAPGTAILAESGGADVGAGLGPWTSPGEAAGDVFGTPILLRLGGATFGGGTNVLVHDNPTLALAPDPPPLDPAEDDLDALECIGDNTFSWLTGAPALLPGNLHARVAETVPLVDLGGPGESVHDPRFEAPNFFSVTRSSPGALLSAVRTQFVLGGGAGADIYVTAPGMNLLFLDNLEIGLMPMDDLDALILEVCPQYRPLIAATIRDLVMNHGAPGNPWMPYMVGGDTLAFTGPGLSMSIVKYLGLAYGVQVGFSVTTDSQGLEYTGVDWEAGPVGGGISAAAGDIFYARPAGAPMNPNYLWYEETDVGELPGTWVNGASVDLAVLSDNMDGLDSWHCPPDSLESGSAPLDGPRPEAAPELGPNFPNPFGPRTRLAYSLGGEARVLLVIHDVQGRRVATLVDGVQTAGRHEVDWEARDDRGARLAAGTYFARLEAEGETRTRKIVLLK